MPTHERVALALEPGAATRVHTNVQFKRNKAKGPNPLAVKKKIAKPAAQGAQARARALCRARARGHQSASVTAVCAPARRRLTRGARARVCDARCARQAAEGGERQRKRVRKRRGGGGGDAAAAAA